MRPWKAKATGLVIVAGIALALGASAGCEAGRRSSSGKYEAVTVRTKTGIHYQVKEGPEGRVVLTTCAQYSTWNDVKCGRFSKDSTMFAAGYHYAHAGKYTWVGVWSLPKGKFVRSVRLDGWHGSIPDSVFKEDKEDED